VEAEDRPLLLVAIVGFRATTPPCKAGSLAPPINIAAFPTGPAASRYWPLSSALRYGHMVTFGDFCHI
jgi:hypothetical protein